MSHDPSPSNSPRPDAPETRSAESLAESNILRRFDLAAVAERAPSGFIDRVRTAIDGASGPLELLAEDQAEEHLSAFLDGELEPELEDRLVLTVASSAALMKSLSELKALTGLLTRELPLTAPGGFAEAVAARAFAGDDASPSSQTAERGSAVGTEVAETAEADRPAASKGAEPMRIGPRPKGGSGPVPPTSEPVARPLFLRPTAWLSAAAALTLSASLLFLGGRDRAPQAVRSTARRTLGGLEKAHEVMEDSAAAERSPAPSAKAGGMDSSPESKRESRKESAGASFKGQAQGASARKKALPSAELVGDAPGDKAKAKTGATVKAKAKPEPERGLAARPPGGSAFAETKPEESRDGGAIGESLGGSAPSGDARAPRRSRGARSPRPAAPREPTPSAKAPDTAARTLHLEVQDPNPSQVARRLVGYLKQLERAKAGPASAEHGAGRPLADAPEGDASPRKGSADAGPGGRQDGTGASLNGASPAGAELVLDVPAESLEGLLALLRHGETAPNTSRADPGQPATGAEPKTAPAAGDAAKPAGDEDRVVTRGESAHATLDTITLKDGWSLSGRITNETAAEITISTAGRAVVVGRSEIARIQRGARSADALPARGTVRLRIKLGKGRERSVRLETMPPR